MSSEQIIDDTLLNWLESVMWLVQTRRRPPGMRSPMITARPTIERIQRMDDAVQRGFEAIGRMALNDLAQAVTDSYDAMADMIPDFAPSDVDGMIKKLRAQHAGVGLTGAGGGGYAVVISENRPEHGIPVTIRRKD